jgi:signal transduction histidine kinase
MSAKLLAGQLLVVVAGAGTLLLVAVAVGPGIFHHHVRDALGYVPPEVLRHLDMAYNDATLISLSIAVAASIVTALLVSALVSARVVRPVRGLAGAAQRIAGGTRSARVPVHGTDELRTPLATVESYVEALADGVLALDEENWGAIRSETARLGRLVEDLQRVSQAEAHQLDLHRSMTDPRELVQTAVKAAGPAFQAKNVALESHAENDVPVIEVDGDRITEVLANLLANALRHTPPGGTVSVSAARRADVVVFEVADTGEGIATEHLERVFERFYRVDPARARASGGSGIGLAIARAIVEAHGGTVAADSDGPGRGATFTVRLPAHNQRLT